MQKMRPSIKEKGHRRGFGKDEGSHEVNGDKLLTLNPNLAYK